ncbi:unnamed protein product [Brassica napus]|uniref:(rape) hypothetical protein n=1 Tax=Brassica napus TaxID=3708 RepID=A0A816IVL3_BRANA|nr:unnamed protein product [Brassica napus]
MRKGVLESEFTEEIVRISDDRSHSGRDVGEKVTILEDELMGFAKSINFLRCRGSNSNWRINQDHNLYQITQEKEQRPFSEGEISTFMSQMLQVLAHMHKNSYFHRQLKPKNLLVTSNILKIADFGLACEVASMPPRKCRTSVRTDK